MVLQCLYLPFVVTIVHVHLHPDPLLIRRYDVRAMRHYHHEIKQILIEYEYFVIQDSVSLPVIATVGDWLRVECWKGLD